MLRTPCILVRPLGAHTAPVFPTRTTTRPERRFQADPVQGKEPSMNRRPFRQSLLFGVGCLLLSALPASAQQVGRVTGTVTDAQSGAPLSEVQVYLVDAQLGALSRANGRYLILNI